MRLTNFIENGKFYKANYHAHSTRSDGQLSQEEAVNVFKEHGYNFLCLSEHNIVTKTDKYNTDDFILVPGVELHSNRDYPLTIHHLLGLTTMDNDKIYDGMRLEDIPFTESKESLLKLEKTVLDLDLLTVYCHPTWSRVEPHQYDFLKDTHIVEICNWGTVYSQNHDNDRVYWEMLLKQGKQIWGMANDDSHRREQYCGGWNMVKCEEFTVESMLDSLRKGSFYATTGPEIYDFYIEDGYGFVKCSEAKTITFVTLSRWGKCYRDPAAKLTEASLNLSSSAYMVRVEVEDKYGNVAWSNPIMRMDRFEY